MSTHTTKSMLHLIHIKAAPFHDHSYVSTHSYRFSKCHLTPHFPSALGSVSTTHPKGLRQNIIVYLCISQHQPKQLHIQGYKSDEGNLSFILRNFRFRRKKSSHSHISFRHANLTGAKNKKETSGPNIKGSALAPNLIPLP